MNACPRRCPWLIAAIIVVILVAAYCSVSYYVKKTATTIVNQAIATIKQQHPFIQDISYQKIDASAFSLFTHHYLLQGVVITPADTNLQVAIQSIDLKNYQLSSQQTLTAVSLQFNHMTLPNITTALPNVTLTPYVIAQVNSLNADLTLDYQATTQTLSAQIALNHGNNPWLQYQLIIANFLITHPLNDMYNADALNQAYIQSSNSTLNIQTNKTKQQLNQEIPIVASILQSVGYDQLALSITGSGTYSNTDKTAIGDITITAQNAGTLHLYSKQLNPEPATLSTVATFLTGTTGKAAQQIQPLLVTLQVQYQDHGLVNQAITAAAMHTQQSPAQIRSLLQGILSANPNLSAVPALQNAASQIATFLNQPGTLTIAFQPAQPANVQLIVQRFQKELIREAKVAKTFKKMTPEQQEPAREQLMKQHNQAMNQLLQQLGFTVTAS